PRDTACVFLVECSPDTETAEALGRYVAAGGSLLAVQGAEPIAGGAVELLPGRALAAREGEPRALRDLDRHHPIFAPLARGETPLDLGAATFFSVSRVEPREGARVLASFGPGEPAILERSLGLGKVVLVASSLHPDATSFPLKVSFVPFVQSVVEHLAAPATESRLVGDPIVLRVPAEGAPATAKLLRPGAEPIEAKREVASGIASFAFGRADRPGAVTLEWLAPDRIESRAVVTNVDPEEGVLDVLDPARVVPGAPVVASADELGPLVRQLRHGRDLGLAFAIAALAAILLEAFLANRFAFGGRAPLEPALARA
ncbi:MAG TPA: hypothetical protein VFF73_14050, partial [Planctomycetota bacterium]|nr:hypothetical protein [Planctomycetota bacterium]